VLLKITGYTLQKNNEHGNNYITKTNYHGDIKNRAVDYDFRWQRIACTVDPPARTTQAASLRRLVGLARGPIRTNGQIRLKPALRIWRKPCIFYIYCFSNAFTMKQTHRLWSRANETWVFSKESTCTECPYCLHRSGLDGEFHSNFEDLQDGKKYKTHTNITFLSG